MSHAVYALLAVVLASSAGAGIMLQDADVPSGLTTFEGKVVHVAWNPHFEVAVSFQVHNGTDDATYTVELGPPWWWAEVGLPQIEVNDTLKVEGVVHEGQYIEAYTIWINGGSPVVIREGGMPKWAQMKSGHTDDDSDDE